MRILYRKLTLSGGTGMAVLAQVGVCQPMGSPADLFARAEGTGSDKQAADTGHSPGRAVPISKQDIQIIR